MKTYLTYGFAMALAGGLLTLILFFLGFHSDAEKMSTAQWVVIPIFLAITVVTLILGAKARREELPPTERFGYGRAFGGAMLILLFGALIGMVFNYAYVQFINPGFADVIIQSQAAKMEAKGLGPAQIERMENMTRMMMKPPIFAFVTFIQGMLAGTVIALITSAFVRREPTTVPPPLS